MRATSAREKEGEREEEGETRAEEEEQRLTILDTPHSASRQEK